MEIQKLENESNLIYLYRKTFIENCTEFTDMRDLIKYSKILANIKFKKCKYEPKIYNSVKEYL
jgi:hypothetical protein